MKVTGVFHHKLEKRTSPPWQLDAESTKTLYCLILKQKREPILSTDPLSHPTCHF